MKKKNWRKGAAVMLSISLSVYAAAPALASENTAGSDGTAAEQSQQSTSDGDRPSLPQGNGTGFDPGNLPEGFNPGSTGTSSDGTEPESGDMPQGFDPGNLPEGFDPGSMGTPPDGAEPESGDMPEGFDPGNLPEGFDPGSMNFGSGSKAEGQIGSWSSGGTDADSLNGNDYDYDAALYVTADGIDEEKSSTDRITSGTYDGSSASGVVLEDSQSGDNGIIVDNASYTISDADIDLDTDADGTDTCDFSGKGTAIAVYGSDSNVTVENSQIHTSGVATMPLFADDGATLTVRSSTIQSDGGTLYASYMNTPDQALMVAPPWILGIMGTSRASNVMGNDTTMNFVDSEASAGSWAVLSTDSGSNMYLNVYNSTLTLNNQDESATPLQAEGGEISETLDNPYTENYGTGYGTFAIGDAVETFAGVTFNVGTYATIFTGGKGLFTSLEKGKTYELKNSAGEVTGTYEATEDKVTTINSDTFGFMAHQGTNDITLENGTVVNSGYATFLVKTGYSNETLTASVDECEISNGGVLIQVMDNDDATNGGMMAADDAENTNGGVQNFKSTHSENAGFNTDSASAGSTAQTFTFTNGTYSGNIYNASGSDGLEASALNVSLGEGAVLNGAAASTSAIHVTYDGSVSVKNERNGAAFDNAEEAAAFAETYQNTEFGIEEYYSIGQVANLVNDNGANSIQISLSGDAVWNVTGTSLISALTITDDAQVVVPEGVTLTVGSTQYTGCTLTAADLA